MIQNTEEKSDIKFKSIKKESTIYRQCWEDNLQFYGEYIRIISFGKRKF